MGLNGYKVFVVGAGIGGLVAALCLRARGADVTVLEQAGAITEVGAGLQISPNGVAVLRALDLENALAAASVRARAVVLRDYSVGDQVVRLDLGRLAADQAYYFVHRADLIDLLVDAVRRSGAQIRLLQQVQRIEPAHQASDQAQVFLANGSSLQADLVVGADGLHSRARQALNATDAPFFTQQVAWRAVVPNVPSLDAEAQVFMGPGRHLVCYPLRGGSMVNIVAVTERADWAEEGWQHTDDPENLRAVFAGFGGQARALLDQVNKVSVWGLFRHPVAQCWHKGGVALVGDAAHPTLPFMAQGANMALEDAWVLANSLERHGVGGAGLAAYQATRRDRAVRVIEAANGNAWKYHLRPGPIRTAAHLALRLGGVMAPGRMVHQFDWLYGHDVTA